MSPTRLLLGVACLLTAGALLPPARAEAPAAGTKVRQIKVVADKAPDCSSLASIVQSVTRGCKTNDAKAVALYNFMLLTHYHQGYPGEKGGLGALKEINVYGWSLCGGLHTVQAALWREAGWPWRFVGWNNPGHTTVEAQYDGRWHYLDVFLRYYTWMPDANAPAGRTIAGQDDLKANPALITGGLELDRARKVYYHKDNLFEVIGQHANWRAPSFLSCGDEPEGIVTGIRTSHRSGSPTGWAGLQFDSPGYSTDVNLAPGHALTLTWDAIPGGHWWNGRKYVPGHGCGDKDYRNCPAIGPILEPYRSSGGLRRSFANGTLQFAPDLGSSACLGGFAATSNVRWTGGKLVPVDASRPGSVTVELQSPYVMTRASGKADGADTAEISVDSGKTFKAIKLEDFSEEVGGRYACQVRLSFPQALSSLRLETLVQCHRGALPYLSPGPNQITVTVADPKDLGDNRLVVTYAYQAGFRNRSYENLADTGAEVARAHGASWSDRPTVVQKVFTARDLPATFNIALATPADKYPVYPRMLFVRREVVPPGATPLPLPRDAVAPVAGTGAVLKTLPNPFTVGLDLPPKKVSRPTAKRTVSLQVSHAVSKDGRTEPSHHLKWKEGETWVLLVGGELKGLPAPRDIAAARLSFPVICGSAKAATKVGITALAASFQANAAFDFKGLVEVVGTTVVPRQPDGANYNPPRTFTVDVSRAVRRVAAGEAPFHGFALRVIQERAVDEGWLIRVDLPRAAALQLELDVYARE